MVTKIFTIVNEHSAFIRWRRERVGSDTRIVSYSDHGGLCAGMTATWLKKSIATGGRGIRNLAELGSLHLMAIVHGAFARKPPPEDDKLNTVDSIIPLLTTQNLAVWESLRGTKQFDTQGIVVWVSFRPCHCVFVFVDQTYQHGHVIGMRCEGDMLEIFDPNRGLFQYPDIKSCTGHLQKVILADHPRCLGGDWGVFRVV